MALEPTSAILEGGDDGNHLQNLADIPTGDGLPSVNPDTSDALDALLAKQTAEKEGAPDPAPVATVTPVTPATPVTPDPAAVVAPVVPAPTYDSIEPPPNVKPKTAEAFTQIKTLAKEAVTAAEKRAADAEARAAKLEEDAKASKSLTPETEKELEELRTFRKSLEVESDPQFKEFDTKIAANEEFILSRLKQAGASDELVAKVKEIGVSDVNWDELAGKLPPSLRRIVDAKLVENETIAENKKQAITKAKANVDEFFKARTEAEAKQTTARQEKTKAEVDRHLPQMGWLAVKPIPADAKPEEKAALEAHNKLVTETKEDIGQALQDDSPEMRAVLVLGFAQLKRVRADLAAVQAETAAGRKALEAQIATLTKERDDAKKFVEKFKGASTARIQSSAPPSGEPKKVEINHNTDTASALDTLLAAKLAEREG